MIFIMKRDLIMKSRMKKKTYRAITITKGSFEKWYLVIKGKKAK